MWTFTDVALASIPLLAIPWLIGTAVFDDRVAGPARWCFAVTFSGVFLTVLHALGVSFSAAAWALLTLVVLVLLVRPRRIASAAGAWIPPTHAERIRGAIWLVLILSAGAYGLAHPVSEHDAVDIWFLKARGLCEGLTFSELALPNYPNGGAALWTLVMVFIGSRAEEIGRLVFPLYFFVWGMALRSVWSGERRRMAGWAALAITLALLGKSAFSGYQDDFLMASAGISALFLLRLTLDSDAGRSDRFLAFFFAGSLVFVKNEGAILAAILVSCWFLSIVLRKGLSGVKAALVSVWPMLLMGVALSALWPALLVWNDLPPERVQGDSFTVRSLLGSIHNLDRLGAILPYIGAYLARHIEIVLATVLLSVVGWRLDERVRGPLLFLGTTWLLHNVFIVVVFLSTTADLDWHLRSACKRLMTQHQFVFALAFCLCAPVLWDRVRAFTARPK